MVGPVNNGEIQKRSACITDDAITALETFSLALAMSAMLIEKAVEPFPIRIEASREPDRSDRWLVVEAFWHDGAWSIR